MAELDNVEMEDAPWDHLEEDWDEDENTDYTYIEDDPQDDPADNKRAKHKSGSNPNIMGKDALSKRPMTVESYYDILENDDNDLLFTIKFVNSPLIEGCKPIMYYDGKQHAIFVKNEDITIICDYVHPGVRGSLGKASKVLFAELKDGAIEEEYMVDVLHVPGIEEIAFMHVSPIG